MNKPEGFSVDARANGDLVVRHHRRVAVTLKGKVAQKFLTAVAAGGDEQQLLARLTGNYKRGNERRGL